MTFNRSSCFKDFVQKFRTIHLPRSNLPSTSNFQLSDTDGSGSEHADADIQVTMSGSDEDTTDIVVVDSLLAPGPVPVASSGRPSNAGDPNGVGRSSSFQFTASTLARSHALLSTGIPEQVIPDALETNGKYKVRRPKQTHLLWPIIRKAIEQYFDLRFDDKQLERVYSKEVSPINLERRWYARKRLALVTSLFIAISWLLYCIFSGRPWSGSWKLRFVVIVGIPSIALPFAAIFDLPRRHHILWQTLLFYCIWCRPIVLAVELHLLNLNDERMLSAPGVSPMCGAGSNATVCAQKSFHKMFYFAAAYPVLAVMCLEQTRAWALFGCVAYAAIFGALVVAESPTWLENLILLILFQIVINILSYSKETIDRQAFLVRYQLKLQYRATQRAQHLEHKAADLKNRFVSYIFHEIRVPLNTARLALENLCGEDLFGYCDDDQREVVDALSGSLGMMTKVLNDILDFNKMEDGRFAWCSQPLDLHAIVRSLCVGARVVTESKGIILSSDLDDRLDSLFGGDEKTRMKLLLGDEMRVRQILSNLIGNACKFTGRGGTVMVRTSLLWPHAGGGMDLPTVDSVEDFDVNASRTLAELPILRNKKKAGSIDGVWGGQHCIDIDPIPHHGIDQSWATNVNGGEAAGGSRSDRHESRPPELALHDRFRAANRGSIAIVRFEIEDSGSGIHRSEIVGNRLFSPYVQTAEGRRQGGKGTGLGLAIVRHIVQLGGGRLGLRTKYGVGSCFWVELPFEREDANQCVNGGKEFQKVVNGGKEFHQVVNSGTSKDLISLYKDFSGDIGGSELDIIIRTGMAPALEWRSHSTVDDRRLEAALPLCGASVDALFTPTPSPPPKLPQFDHPTAKPPPDTPCPSPITSKATAPPIAKTSNLYVLVVDDDKVTRLLMSRMITRLGHRVMVAEDGSCGLNILLGLHSPFATDLTISSESPQIPRFPAISHTHPTFDEEGKVVKNGKYETEFDLIFTDNSMPVMTGVEFIRHVRGLGLGVCTCGITGNATEADQQEFLDAGLDW
ncbi:HisKA [Rhizophlyctis rosea]|nr:HisKA [Rhizophlyctis rosea]